MEGKGDPASQARALFKRFLAERWFGGLDFDSWVRHHPELEDELVRLRDEWFAQLADEESPATLLETRRGWRSAESFEEGEVLGGFRLRQRLGRGAMGEVWAAEEFALGNRPVALKLLRPDLLPDRRALERFRREALAGARIRHPGIVAVYSAGRAQGQPYIAMELVEGGLTLAALIAAERGQGRPAAEHFKRVARLVAQAADALQAVHDQGMLHRDVKPQNILVAPGDVVKVGDFGLAHLAGEHVLSRTGDVMGTYCYMSPAQVRGEVKRLDGRADVFSLGATLYELVTLERAFNGDSPHEIARKILHEDPPSARALGLHVPRDLERICAKALEKHPPDRYSSMGELADDLRRFLRGEPILARATSFRGRVRKWARRHPTVSVGLAVAAVGMLGIAWFARVYAHEARGRLAAQREALFAKAQVTLELGDLEQARHLVDQAIALDAGDPMGHLILATGFARHYRLQDVEEQLRLARAKGFADDPARLESGLEHGAYGLYLLGRSDLALWPEAERHLRLALELDPGFYPLHYALFRIRSTMDDTPGAVAELEAFQAHLGAGEPLYQIVESRRLTELGDDRGALAVLERLGQALDLDEARLSEVNWHANIGRACLRLHELERAEGYLRRAVEHASGDCWSWEALALVYLERLYAGQRDALVRSSARECANRARECSPLLENPHIVLAYVAELELQELAVSADPTATPAWKEAREALDGLRAAQPQGSTELGRFEAYLLFLQGRGPYSSGDYARAAELYERALEHDAGDIRSAALLGQCYWHLGRPAEGLALLERALAAWDEPLRSAEIEPWWLGALLAWILGNADKAGEPESFARARERFVGELERRSAFHVEELLSAAEFLATASKELRDCALAWRLIEEHALDTAFDGTPNEAEAHQILQRIADACR